MKKIPFIDLAAQQAHLQPEIDARMQQVLAHGQYIMGPEVGELEQALADFVGGGFVVGVSSGTDALLMALLALGIGRGDAVFVPTFTFTATAEVVLLLGATPVFVDVCEDSCNLDPEDLERRIAQVTQSGALRPKAVIAVDLYGLPADYPRLRAVVDAHGLRLIGDGAQSLSASCQGRQVGQLADITATSFFPAKPLGCFGDGGAIFTEDRALAEILRSIRAHGKGTEKYDIVRVGVNGRLDTLQAAVLLAKLPALRTEQSRREQLSRRYDAALAGAARLPARRDAYVSAWAQYTIQVPQRGRLQQRLSDAGIPTQIYYPRPMHLQPAYRPYGGGGGSLPVAERLSQTVLSLPMHPYMPGDVADYICEHLSQIVSAYAEG